VTRGKDIDVVKRGGLRGSENGKRLVHLTKSGGNESGDESQVTSCLGSSVAITVRGKEGEKHVVI